jgi:hypothetical protein
LLDRLLADESVVLDKLLAELLERGSESAES